MEPLDKVTEILCDLCGAEPGELTADFDLFDTGLLDSFGVIELVLALEEAFGVTLQIEQIPRGRIATPQKIAALVREARQT